MGQIRYVVAEIFDPKVDVLFVLYTIYMSHLNIK